MQRMSGRKETKRMVLRLKTLSRKKEKQAKKIQPSHIVLIDVF